MLLTKNNKNGFTLIELAVVIAILGMTAIGIYMSLIGKIKIGHDAKRKHDIETIKSALNQYYDSKECFPLTLGSCGDPLVLGSDKLLYSLPCDPSTNQTYAYETQVTSCPQWFRIYTNLENTSDNLIDVTGCQYGCGSSCQYNYGISSPNIPIEYCEAPVTPTATPTDAPPTPTPLQYACAPGGGQTGNCVLYDDPSLGGCPIVYPGDPLCSNECNNHDNRCQSANGQN